MVSTFEVMSALFIFIILNMIWFGVMYFIYLCVQFISEYTLKVNKNYGNVVVTTIYAISLIPINNYIFDFIMWFLSLIN